MLGINPTHIHLHVVHILYTFGKIRSLLISSFSRRGSFFSPHGTYFYTTYGIVYHSSVQVNPSFVQVNPSFVQVNPSFVQVTQMYSVQRGVYKLGYFKCRHIFQMKGVVILMYYIYLLQRDKIYMPFSKTFPLTYEYKLSCACIDINFDSVVNE